jgi:uncharacterized lipoprotein NlpE involved in copper resistance
MLKKLILGLTITIFILTGCGENKSTSKSAENILKGKTFYYVDEELNDPNGYYEDIFGSNSLTENEYSEDGTKIDTTIIPIAYSGNKIIIDDDGVKFDCTVTQNDNSVGIFCPINNYTQMLWMTIEDAKSHPQQ